jgi:hypothetical protein
MTSSTITFDDDGDLKFPVITISVSQDDLEEPVHVDLGSIPPFLAAAIFEKVALALRAAVPGPKITFKGYVVSQPFNTKEVDINSFFFDDGDDDEETP